MEDNDAQLQLKKRARRRLIGAVFFVSIVAIVLPTIMDQEPRQQVQDVEIRIPGQDDKPFAPKFPATVAEKPAEVAPVAAKPVEKPQPVPEVAPPVVPQTVVTKPTARVIDPPAATAKPVEKPAPKPAEKPVDKPAATKPEKTPEKPAAKAPEKPAEKTADKPKPDDAKRAAAILAGQADAKPGTAKGGEYLILIGAFSSEDNVRNLKAKLGEVGVKSFSEPLDTPQGRKTRVRAGPFASREAADKALDKMKKIGIAGVVAAKP